MHRTAPMLVCPAALIALGGCSFTTTVNEFYTTEATAGPALSAHELAAMEPDGRVFSVHADLAQLELFIEDANPTDWSWQGLRLALDDDRYRGEALWIAFGDGLGEQLRVDPAIGGIVDVPTVQSTVVSIATNAEAHAGQTGSVVLTGRWTTLERRRTPMLVLSAVSLDGG